MTHTWQKLTHIHGLGAELPSHVFNPDKQVYHSPKIDKKLTQSVTCGVKQGCMLSPTLFKNKINNGVI